MSSDKSAGKAYESERIAHTTFNNGEMPILSVASGLSPFQK